MATLTANRLVTRGLGASRGVDGRVGILTAGGGGPPLYVLDQLRMHFGPNVRRIVGQSGTKRRERELQLRQVMVAAKLLRVNNQTIPENVQGYVASVADTPTRQVVKLIEHVSTRVRSVWEDIKVTAKRIK